MNNSVLADTITKIGTAAYDKVVVCGSHGGIYAAYLAAKAGVRAVIFNDAGVGKDAAGIGGLGYCEALGLAVATVAHDSARIGDAADMLSRGRLSYVNKQARATGCKAGLDCRSAAALLAESYKFSGQVPHYEEARAVLIEEPGYARIVCVDSASLIRPEDVGQIVITGSHGGLVGANKAMALQVDALAAIFNDAGIGINDAGVGRLSALDERGIAAATVAAASARIGDARSTYEDGILSCINTTARGLGGVVGMSARDFVQALRMIRVDRVRAKS